MISAQSCSDSDLSVKRPLRRPFSLAFNPCMLRWWEWLGRILLTLLTMGVVGYAIVLGALFLVLPSSVDDWRSQVIVPMRIATGIAVSVSFLVGILVWRHYPSMLRRRGIGWGTRVTGINVGSHQSRRAVAPPDAVHPGT